MELHSKLYRMISIMKVCDSDFDPDLREFRISPAGLGIRDTDTPVVLMSSIPEPAVPERCSGYLHFVRKPFKLFDIVDRVADIVGQPA